MEKIFVDLGKKSYDIEIAVHSFPEMGQKIRALSKADKVAIITDHTVDALYGPQLQQQLETQGFSVRRLVMEAGEDHKNLETFGRMVRACADFGMTRSDLVITLGGGVPGDLGGFVAASFLRGVAFIQVPTTLLAQIDSSVGGKVAVDLPEGKNLVGAFYQPKGVLMDPELLRSLDPRYLHDGLAEVIKCATFGDPDLFAALEQWSTDEDILHHVTEISAACCRLKVKVVEEDERDVGARMVLNFGHTIGHAVERYYHYEKYTHGEGVAIGMVRLTRNTEKLGLTRPGTADRIQRLLARYHIPTEDPIPDSAILEGIQMDKKKRGNQITLVIVPEIGKSLLKKVAFADLEPYVKG
ncbi:3-dehydroquinate synthase [Acidaminococcus timonensis]|uniref:3-dehydroquinate synthase n=1 Tax=Acidaminococcus timonensis TaxID=1871002 RepID=UPI002942174F|nr:3-dehydroquinate synthase [Acidaminococcus timonensis]